MLRLVEPNGPLGERAYRVPWEVDRTRAPLYSIQNCSAETAFRVGYQFLASGEAVLCGEIEPGGRFTIDARLTHPNDVAVSLTWLRPDESAFIGTFSD